MRKFFDTDLFACGVFLEESTRSKDHIVSMKRSVMTGPGYDAFAN
jgi:hypothetical protein